MINSNLVYELAKKLDLIIEVTKKGKYVGKFKFIDDVLHKLKENEKLDNNSKKEEMR